jgi:hypothetical protein
MNHTRSERFKPRRDLSYRARTTGPDANTVAALPRLRPRESAWPTRRFGATSRWEILLVMPHCRRQPDPVVHRFFKNRVTWRGEHSDFERAYRYPQTAGLRSPPNKSCYRRSGRSESGCDTRYQPRARIFCARLRDGPVLSDTSRRNGMLSLFGADMPCSGIYKRALSHPWRQRGAIRSDTAQFVPCFRSLHGATLLPMTRRSTQPYERRR